MSNNNGETLLKIERSEIKGFVKENYGSVTFVYNFPQQASDGIRTMSTRSSGEMAVCPYQGLSVFQPENAEYFFGREAAIDRVVRLTKRSGLTAVTGASGSGKSSLVFAGVVPELVRSKNWLFTTFRPGEDPFYTLAGALVPLMDAAGNEGEDNRARITAVKTLAEELRKKPDRLQTAMHTIREKNSGKRLLIIADQFEELYSLCQDAEVRKLFLDRLHDAIIDQGEVAERLVLTIRADFLGELVSDRRMADALQNQFDLLGPMTRAELTDAIVEPAALLGVAYEEHLVDRILDDLGDDDGSLPLLEFALTQLWETQTGSGLLTHTAYEKIGRVSGAIAQHAEAAYARLDQQERQLTRRLFRRLVSLPDQRSQDTQRITRRQVDLQSLDVAIQTLAKGELSNRRLVVISHVSDQRDTVEIVHETLLTQWPELAKWISEDRETILRLQVLSSAVAAYEQSGMNPDMLYRGKQLRDYLVWADEHKADLADAERSFLIVSQRYQRRRVSIQYGGYAIAGLITLLVTVAIILWPSDEIPIPMPAEDFNIAVASLDIAGLASVEDEQLKRYIERDAEAIADDLVATLHDLGPQFADLFGSGRNVNILTSDRFKLTSHEVNSVAEVAQSLRANVLIYGTIYQDSGRHWAIQPAFYIDHAATAERAAEISHGDTLLQSVSFISNNESSREEAILALKPTFEHVFQLYRGLDFYDQGTVAGYHRAAEIFCTNLEEDTEQGQSNGVDLLALFCGHSYSELFLMTDPTSDLRKSYGETAINAYKTALRANPTQLRAKISLPALLIMIYKPGLGCNQGDLEEINESLRLLTEAASQIETLPNLREGTKLGYLLNRGHALFWLGLCQDFDKRVEQWRSARDYYLQSIKLAEQQNTLRIDIADFNKAEAHAQIAYIYLWTDLLNSQGADLFAGEPTNFLEASADHFATSLTLLFQHTSEPRVAQFAHDIIAHGIYTLCKAERIELAHQYLTDYDRQIRILSREEMLAAIEQLDPQLRVACNL